MTCALGQAKIVWVRWARYLAARGVDVLRLDYRGCGESTGRFEEMTLPHWEEDVRAGLEHLRRACPGVPVVLHGLRLGALLAARVFQTDAAAGGLLLWEPPESGRAHLLEVLRRKEYPALKRRNHKDNQKKGRSLGRYVVVVSAGVAKEGCSGRVMGVGFGGDEKSARKDAEKNLGMNFPLNDAKVKVEHSQAY